MNFTQKIKSFFSAGNVLSAEFFDDLADLLVEGDLGAQESFATADTLRETCKKEKITSPEKARARLADLLEDSIKGIVTQDLQPDTSAARTMVILVLGVNGVGKTTTAAKLASMYHQHKPILAAADTFRAAAIDQLKIHGQRLGLRVVAHQHGGDPAAVVYDAIEAAGAGGIVIADTAGRMHTKSALVDELKKIDRVVETKAAGAGYVKYLVLDATTGRNAFAQAEIFCDAVSPDAAIIAKYDSTAKAGVIFSLASRLRLPVAYLCTGEQYGDIRVFNPHNFAREFAGIM